MVRRHLSVNSLVTTAHKKVSWSDLAAGNNQHHQMRHNMKMFPVMHLITDGANPNLGLINLTSSTNSSQSQHFNMNSN